jgi:ribosomal protein S18 acetylase RimI-like enzyme
LERKGLTSAPVIRRLAPDEAALYRALRFESLTLAPEAFGATLESSRAIPEERWKELLARDYILCAFSGGQALGMARLSMEHGPKDRHKSLLTGMYVRPEVRGQGVGRAIVLATLEQAQGLAEQVLLNVVTTNLTALRLYESVGFVRYGLQRQALKSADGYADEILMVKFLDAAASAR